MRARNSEQTDRCVAIQPVATFQKVAVLVFAILCVAMAAPAFGASIYDDGPTDGTTNAFFIDGPGTGPFQQSISNGFYAQNPGNAASLEMAMWVPTGTVPLTATWSLSAIAPFGSEMGSGSNMVGETYLFTNGFGYDVWQLTFAMNSQAMNTTTQYWLTMSDANDSSGTQHDAWDLNGGGALCVFAKANQNLGDCGNGGEAFVINPAGSTTPEPASLALMGSGVLGLGGFIRRRLRG